VLTIIMIKLQSYRSITVALSGGQYNVYGDSIGNKCVFVSFDCLCHCASRKALLTMPD